MLVVGDGGEQTSRSRTVALEGGRSTGEAGARSSRCQSGFCNVDSLMLTIISYY